MLCPVHSKPNAETPKSAAKKGFIHKAARKGDGRTSLRAPHPAKARGLRNLWGKEAGWS